MIQCQHCNTPMEDGATFCGNCGNQVAPLQAPGATVLTALDQGPARGNWSMPAPPTSRYGPPSGPGSDTPTQYAQNFAPPTEVMRQERTPQTSPSFPSRRIPFGRNRNVLLAALILLVVIVAGTLAALFVFKGSSSTIRQVTFVDGSSHGSGHTDALNIVLNNLDAPPSGSHYDAWLINSKNEQIVALGTLQANGSNFSLNFPGNGKNLLGLGDKLSVTQEQGSVDVPTGKLIFSGTFPPNAFIHIRHLLFSFPITPNKVGLLTGLQGQTQQLDNLAKQLQQNGDNQTIVQCASQGIVDIIEGSHGAHYKQLHSSCASNNITTSGDGFGLLGQNGYISLTAQHAALAANQSDTTALIRSHANEVQIATTNIKGWATTIEQDALSLLHNPTDVNKVSEIVTLSNNAYQGVDTNNDGKVDPVKGEAGAVTGYMSGQLMATLPLV